MRALLFVIAVAGCTGDDADDNGMDATTSPDSATPDGGAGVEPVRIGTGQDMYEPLVDDDTVVISQGVQGGGGRFGGFHVFGGVRLIGFNTTQPLLTFEAMDDVGTLQAMTQVAPPSLQPDGDGFVYFGAQPPLMDCCSIANKTVVLRVSVEDQDGKQGMDEVTVNAGRCFDRATNNNVCP